MRVYELAKKLGVSSKKILEALDKKGVDVKNHMSALSDEDERFLQQTLAESVTKKPNPQDINKSTDTMQKQSVVPVSQKNKPRDFSRKPSTTISNKASVPLVEPLEAQEASPVVAVSMSVGDLAEKMNKSANDVIVLLLKWRILASKNQLISADVVKRVLNHYEIPIAAHVSVTAHKSLVPLEKEGKGELKERLPIVVVLGHVDHGKTTLLDFVRKTRVVAKEKGGITQHLGAYEAKTDHGNLIFIDTPGHAAFPKMRQRGIRAADIGILVIAADDAIMPQTIEAIKQLKSMNVPIVVAINKIDKVDSSRIEVVKRQLAEHDLLPEEWGGNIVCIPISAKTGQGVDQLLELVALQSQLLELKASREGNACCFVLESRLEKGRGAVATLICQHGILNVGDYFVCGNSSGRVSSIKDSRGTMLSQVGPSVPVQVAGFKDIPEAGDFFKVVSKEEFRQVAVAPQRQRRLQHVVDDSEFINVIFKADTDSSKEAVLDTVANMIKKSEVGINVINASIGDINEGDVELAFSAGALIIGLHVKVEPKVMDLAHRRNVEIELYDIIYKLFESVHDRLEKAKKIEMVRSKIGEATVRAVFDIKGVGVVAGSYVTDGKVVKNGILKVFRNKQLIGEGPIKSLQRDKKSVKEIAAGYECGFVIEGYTDWAIDDKVECYVEVPKT